MSKKPKIIPLQISWIFSSTIGWSITVLSNFQLVSLVTWNDVIHYGIRFLETGLIVGFLIGFFQYLFLRNQFKLTFRWILYSLVYYPVSLFTAYMVSVFMIYLGFGIPSISWGGTNFMVMPFILILMIAGGLVGFFQVRTNEIKTISLDLVHKVLWIFSSALAWGSGFLFANLIGSSGKFSPFVTTSFGFFSGFVTCILLTLFVFEQRRSENITKGETRSVSSV